MSEGNTQVRIRQKPDEEVKSAFEVSVNGTFRAIERTTEVNITDPIYGRSITFRKMEREVVGHCRGSMNASLETVVGMVIIVAIIAAIAYLITKK